MVVCIGLCVWIWSHSDIIRINAAGSGNFWCKRLMTTIPFSRLSTINDLWGNSKEININLFYCCKNNRVWSDDGHYCEINEITGLCSRYKNFNVLFWLPFLWVFSSLDRFSLPLHLQKLFNTNRTKDEYHFQNVPIHSTFRLLFSSNFKRISVWW